MNTVMNNISKLAIGHAQAMQQFAPGSESFRYHRSEVVAWAKQIMLGLNTLASA